MIKVLVADDEPMIVVGVRTILETDQDMDVVAEARNGREAIELAHAHRPDVVLMDIRMPELDGISAAAEILRTLPETSVCILTTFGDEEYVARALGEGVQGFMLKSGDPRDLIAGVRAVATGGAYLSPSVARWVVAHVRSDMANVAEMKAKVEALTDRERQVLILVAGGHSNAQAAHDLHLVEGTVKAHVSSILIKLDAVNRVQAAIMAHSSGLV